MFQKFQILKKSLKRAKTLKKQRKKTSIYFCLDAFTREEKNSLSKIACFNLIFLNLKSRQASFFWVASSLSILC